MHFFKFKGIFGCHTMVASVTNSYPSLRYPSQFPFRAILTAMSERLAPRDVKIQMQSGTLHNIPTCNFYWPAMDSQLAIAEARQNTNS